MRLAQLPTLRAFRNHPSFLFFACNRLFDERAILSYLPYRPSREPVNVDMCCIISRYFDTLRRRFGSRRYCGILNRELRRERAHAKPLGSLDSKGEKRGTFRTRLVRVCAPTRSPFAFIGNWIRFLCENKDKWRAQVAANDFRARYRA